MKSQLPKKFLRRKLKRFPPKSSSRSRKLKEKPRKMKKLVSRGREELTEAEVASRTGEEVIEAEAEEEAEENSEATTEASTEEATTREAEAGTTSPSSRTKTETLRSPTTTPTPSKKRPERTVSRSSKVASLSTREEAEVAEADPSLASSMGPGGRSASGTSCRNRNKSND